MPTGRGNRPGSEVIGMADKKTIYRSSESGQIVTKQYAESHPRTTEKERVTVPSPKKK
jgi:hypothetical protein